ncbi:preprotein translocase subunit SecG [Candidatus Latescibacterota bacterium]
MLYGLLITLHVLVSIGLIVAVLLQSSKGGGLAGTFGGSGVTGGIFGGRGAAPFLTKATTVLAIMFMLTSLSLNYVTRYSRSESVLERTRIERTPSSQSQVTDEMPVLQEPAEDSAPGESDTESE